jgi:coenzyme F420 biosynthesis associated uncharacterized protein
MARSKDKEPKDSGLKARISALGAAARRAEAAAEDTVPDDASPAPAEVVGSQPDRPGLLAVVSGEAERAALSRITAIMSLLEGHANVVMDSVDRSIIPTVSTIRKRFEKRGSTRSALQRLLLKAIGMDAKQAQYRDGAAFVHAAVDALGMEGFNVIWRGPEFLPTEEELHAPETWVQRMRVTALVGASNPADTTPEAPAEGAAGASGNDVPAPQPAKPQARD